MHMTCDAAHKRTDSSLIGMIPDHATLRCNPTSTSVQIYHVQLRCAGKCHPMRYRWYSVDCQRVQRHG